MLESDGILQTWRLAEPPTPEHPVPAEPIGNHRLAYLDYEGEVSGGRGKVRRWDNGILVGQSNLDSVAIFRIHGTKLKGVLTITPQLSRHSVSFQPLCSPGTYG